MPEIPKGERMGPSPANNEPSDEELAEQLFKGNRRAFDTLVRRHHRRIQGICYRMCNSSADAEDLAQETFLRVYRHRESYQTGRRFRVWLDRICVNVCITHKERTRGRGRVVLLGDTEPGVVAAQGPLHPRQRHDPEARATFKDMMGRFEKVLATLAAPYRAALVLRVQSDLSYQEIAEVLGCSIGTVMSRLNRARIKVRNHLKDMQ
jgi:RNA polymerase sigma-70 factor (ECF subfamily)